MMTQGSPSVAQMLNQSMAVMTKPSVATFEEYEKQGGQREALMYVGTAAAIGAVVAAIAGVLTGSIVVGIIGGVASLILPIVGFFVSAWVVHFVGKQRGGTGTQDEVFYSMSLFMAPILAFNSVVGNIPLLACLALPVSLALGIYQIYLGYLAIRSSMNLDQNNAIITMVLAWVAQMIVAGIIGGIVAGIVVALGAGAGALQGVPVQP